MTPIVPKRDGASASKDRAPAPIDPQVAACTLPNPRIYFVECLDDATTLISIEEDPTADLIISPPMDHKAKGITMLRALQMKSSQVRRRARARAPSRFERMCDSPSRRAC